MELDSLTVTVAVTSSLSDAPFGFSSSLDDNLVSAIVLQKEVSSSILFP